MHKNAVGRKVSKEASAFQAKKPHLDYLGKHTAVSHLYESGLWKETPYLRYNGGMLPPFLIVVGDRRRVSAAQGVLGLKNSAFLDEVAAAKSGKPAFEGRVRILVGTYEREGLGMPLAVVESQMGVPAAQINLREIFAHTRTDGYNECEGAMGTRIEGAYAIRAGSAGGINIAGRSAIRIGELVNASFAMGDIGAIAQALGCMERCDKVQAQNLERAWARLGHQMVPSVTYGHKFLHAQSSQIIVEAITSAAAEMGIRLHIGGNFTKDSLYAESQSGKFVKLRREFGVISTEMEMLALNELSGMFAQLGKELHVGMVVAIVGTIPGGSFATNDEEARAGAKADENALQVAARALWRIFKGAHK